MSSRVPEESRRVCCTVIPPFLLIKRIKSIKMKKKKCSDLCMSVRRGGYIMCSSPLLDHVRVRLRNSVCQAGCG